MKIKWNGHSCFTITADNGTTILTDPYEPGGYGGAVGYSGPTDTVDIVTATHDHADHNFTKNLNGNFEVVKGTRTVKGIAIRGVNAFHDTSQGKERGKNTIMVMDVDGVRVAHLGD